MLDTRFKIILSAVALLLVLSALLPLLFLFGGGFVFAAEAAGAMGEVRPLATASGVEEEMRGIWIATVNNINFPTKRAGRDRYLFQGKRLQYHSVSGTPCGGCTLPLGDLPRVEIRFGYGGQCA